jgi:hypothetical protein
VGYQGLIALINDAMFFMVVCRTLIQLEWGVVDCSIRGTENIDATDLFGSTKHHS